MANKAVTIFLVALLLLDVAFAVPQEARNEIRDKGTGLEVAGDSPVQAKLYQYKRYSNDYNSNKKNYGKNSGSHKSCKKSYSKPKSYIPPKECSYTPYVPPKECSYTPYVPPKECTNNYNPPSYHPPSYNPPSYHPPSNSCKSMAVDSYYGGMGYQKAAKAMIEVSAPMIGSDDKVMMEKYQKNDNYKPYKNYNMKHENYKPKDEYNKNHKKNEDNYKNIYHKNNDYKYKGKDNNVYQHKDNNNYRYKNNGNKVHNDYAYKN